MKLKFFGLLLLLFTVTTFGQNTLKKAPINEFSFLTINLTSPVISYAPRWDLGYYRSLNKKFFAGVEFGYGTYASIIKKSDTPFMKEENYQIWEIRPEIFLLVTEMPQTFVSAELYYINHTDRFHDERYYDPATDIHYKYSSANYERHKYGLNINYGFIAPLGKDFGFIVKAGMGIKKREVDFFNIKDQEQIFYEPEGFFPSSTAFVRNLGDDTGFNLNLDVKFYINLN